MRKLEEALGTIEHRSFELWNDHDHLFERLTNRRPDFVLNFCDTGFRNEARHELHVAALLEMLGIPYSGSGPVALGLCFDKALVRALATTEGIAVPTEALLQDGAALPRIRYPAFIKPNRADGSLGITEASVVADEEHARQYVERLRRELPGVELLVQEFLSGAEYGVGLIGNPDGGFESLPVLEVDYEGLPAGLPRLLPYSSKVDPDSPYWTIAFREARLDRATCERLVESCVRLFRRLDLRDYARFDFRADASGEIKLMEVNPNPAWCWDGKLVHMGSVRGLTHGDVLQRILDAAELRVRSTRH